MSEAVPSGEELNRVSHKLRRDDELVVRIDALDDRGQGVAVVRGDYAGQSRTTRVTTSHVLPGEHVRVQLGRVKRRDANARVLELVQPSPERIAPRCPHHGVPGAEGPSCGGCVLQSLTYDAQLAHKTRHVGDLLESAGFDRGLLQAPIGCEKPWYYRNKMEFSFGRDETDRITLGLYPRGYRYQVLGLDTCHLQSPESAALVRHLAEWVRERGLEPHIGGRGGFLRTVTVREGKRTGDRLVELTTTGDETGMLGGREQPAEAIADAFVEAVLAAPDVPVTSIYWTQHRAVRGEKTRLIEHHRHGETVLREELHLPNGVLRFDVHPRAFFQPNTLQAEVLYAQVIAAADAADAGHVLDLYCGTGTIGLALASAGPRVTGIELQPDAVDNARASAAHNGISGATFYAGDVAKVLVEHPVSEVDVVVVDPPRSGLNPAAVEQVRSIGASRVVYVSCNPASLARDAAIFREHGWALGPVQPVDMFPHTAHIENVAVLTR